MLTEDDKKDLKKRIKGLKAEQEQHEKPEEETGASPWRYAHLGIEFVAYNLIFIFLGYWLDRQWDSSPAMLLIGLAIGFTYGMVRIVRAANE